MKIHDWQSVNNEQLMLWIMHTFAKCFRQHAILKGGMQLMLMSSERVTNDLDYVFVPYQSKEEIVPQIDKVLGDIPTTKIEKSIHSTAGRYRIKVGQADVQIEFNVAAKTASVELSTELLAKKLNELPAIIRIMDPKVALAHKLAAWNERRLLRDLYDVYYMYTHIRVMPEMEIFKQHLNHINSRLPGMKKIRQMSVMEFIRQFRLETERLTEQDLQHGLAPLLKQEKLHGLLPVLKTKLNELAMEIEISL